jgi:hypothetical protein
MATPNKLRKLIGNQTAYAWLSEQLKLHNNIAGVANANEVTTAALYKLISDEEMAIVQRVLKKVKKEETA